MLTFRDALSRYRRYRYPHRLTGNIIFFYCPFDPLQFVSVVEWRLDEVMQGHA